LGLVELIDHASVAGDAAAGLREIGEALGEVAVEERTELLGGGAGEGRAIEALVGGQAVVAQDRVGRAQVAQGALGAGALVDDALTGARDVIAGGLARAPAARSSRTSTPTPRSTA
jgi:hypothetical protein